MSKNKKINKTFHFFKIANSLNKYLKTDYKSPHIVVRQVIILFSPNCESRNYILARKKDNEIFHKFRLTKFYNLINIQK